MSENQVIYHRGGCKSFETVFSPLRDSAVESKGIAVSLEKSTVPIKAFESVNGLPKGAMVNRILSPDTCLLPTLGWCDVVYLCQIRRSQ